MGELAQRPLKRSPGFAALIVGVSWSLLACGGAVADPTDGGPSADAYTESSGDSSIVDTGALDAGPPPDDNPCFIKNHEGCIQCCQDNHYAGLQEYLSLVESCVCGAGPCAKLCALEFCVSVGPATGDKCDECIQSALSGQCGVPVDAGCSADPACGGYLACSNRCPVSCNGCKGRE